MLPLTDDASEVLSPAVRGFNGNLNEGGGTETSFIVALRE
jgi:hypothetical protein